LQFKTVCIFCDNWVALFVIICEMYVVVGTVAVCVPVNFVNVYKVCTYFSVMQV